MRFLPAVRRHCLLATVAAALVLTIAALWQLHGSSYTGLVVFPDLQVVRILSDAPSPSSGIRPGDRLVGFDGRRLDSLADYLAALKTPGLDGRRVPVQVLRGKEALTSTIQVDSYPLFHLSLLGPVSGLTVLAFGLYVLRRKPEDPAAALYLGLTTCLFVLLALRCHPGYLALHSP